MDPHELIGQIAAAVQRKGRRMGIPLKIDDITLSSEILYEYLSPSNPKELCLPG